MLFLLIGLLTGLCLAKNVIVPGKGFDRIISIWLENQVRTRRSLFLEVIRDEGLIGRYSTDSFEQNTGFRKSCRRP